MKSRSLTAAEARHSLKAPAGSNNNWHAFLQLSWRPSQGGVQRYPGLGFGHRAQSDDVQGFAWDGQPIDKTVFEIAVKSGPLTAEESRRLLKAKK
ncbi:MAG TPA: hypothetical protein VN641_13925 [Urbifossiella sp.]|nr:hypothetical protein [Urbifossiella sp.]